MGPLKSRWSDKARLSHFNVCVSIDIQVESLERLKGFSAFGHGGRGLGAVKRGCEREERLCEARWVREQLNVRPVEIVCSLCGCGQPGGRGARCGAGAVLLESCSRSGGDPHVQFGFKWDLGLLVRWWLELGRCMENQQTR